MEVNFEIHGLIHINFNGKSIDLHNDYDFIPERMQITKNKIILIFEKTSFGTNEHLNNFLQFTATNQSFLLTIDPENEYLANDQTLDGITFFPSSDRETNNGLIERTIPQDEDDLIFMFMSGRTIRIAADSISVQEI